eukprot:TRINITY_DN43513_c0_g1_i1.p2 TRINITY_DN43513_c0_g1~~TRINITY_DN43513_c0_g1_i1.p2  ORF type:complete len:118 (-),score=5.01 TRINITY_DN43513_c0_g1_i1:49-402(-)
MSSVSCCSNCRQYARTFALCLKPLLCCFRTAGESCVKQLSQQSQQQRGISQFRVPASPKRSPAASTKRRQLDAAQRWREQDKAPGSQPQAEPCVSTGQCVASPTRTGASVASTYNVL